MSNPTPNYEQLAQQIKVWGQELGFSEVGITDIDLSKHEAQLQRWLDAGYHGSMDYMAAHGMKRARPAELVPGTQRVISVKMNYLPPDASFAKTLKNTEKAYISRYALGRDYHKLMRNRLKKLGQKIEQEIGAYGFRPFVDSAPVLERQLAEKAGLGWRGKHSLLINQEAGSWFFLGELFVDLPLPIDDENTFEGCGKCVACITLCPTGAIVEPYVVDARKCISYLTIEHQGAIPQQYRALLGNRIYGCDDCQLVCPWNRYGKITDEQDFHPRTQLKDKDLLELFAWDEATFLKNTEGSPIRRIGHERWLRNLAVGLGNADFSPKIVFALEDKALKCSELVLEHINWALTQQNDKQRVQLRKTLRLIRIVEKGLPRDA
ncbi:MULTISPECIES: tRNA epoxyqueuosine(34) reductase QueG [Pseudoalteromonas]|uniref:tRNA epoxyqueuosine(34) reductase QueG n=1 Tax=Pseudoalteromonas TaxID=53246 RepID=UPI0007321884|nr:MULTISPECIES: tRNA epoxyqueuosine(34) reductase QueG [Pseudoalteromonas]KTF17753.1 epoxyqueuosine reductase [Pseudoalteromonas sp. H103]MDO6546612.1 tRNA epoxyqueuosine(34) reductase QueG [Pseudoalteromonas carrageenovora]MDO6830583.1 tRNA epoxyqueuosine(34) reductase QueG [Pseudoalteromonas carrageenovora]MDO6834275.1 tRNA epoxyqueuosine(34) reductase QueG [Pseudoalteromonas carrageenovora]